MFVIQSQTKNHFFNKQGITMSKILITGSKSGLGLCIANALINAGHEVIGYDIKDGYDVRNPRFDGLDISNVDVLINCAAVNIINWLEDVDVEQWDKVIDVNAKGIYMMSKELLPELIKTKGTILNIVSNASHMPMTCSLAYNASKGAAEIMTRQLARELTKKHGITVFGISPNKLAGTEMSFSIDKQVVHTRGWSMEEAQRYQLAGILAGEETDPNSVAEFISFLLQDKAHHKALTGCIIPYGL
jgi:NAD(P)-dependent dehydrogenase (short-subunit alcohol dehydrogenase family)